MLQMPEDLTMRTESRDLCSCGHLGSSSVDARAQGCTIAMRLVVCVDRTMAADLLQVLRPDAAKA